MKYNIPARTLRDWMKRLNIKSVFTHNHSSSSISSSSSLPSQNQNNTDLTASTTTTTIDAAAATLAKTNSISVTTVPGSVGQAAIAIKDIKKLKSTLDSDDGNGSCKSNSMAVGRTGSAEEGCGNESLTIKVEAGSCDDIAVAKKKQVCFKQVLKRN